MLFASAAASQTYLAPATPIGPAPISDTESTGNAVNLPSGNSAGGAATSVITDPANSTTIWLGTANGGVWRSTDSGKTFAPLTDNQSSLSIGALTVDPTSPAGARTLVAGFGDFSNADRAGGALNGLIVSHDNGASWQPLGGKAFYGYAIDGVVARGSTIVVASPDPMDGGLFLTTDNGATFVRPVPTGQSATALVADPSRPGRLYAAIVPGDPTQSRVIVSTDEGATWATVFAAAQSGGIIGATTKTIRLSVGPTGALAVGVVNTTLTLGDQAQGIFLSANPATTAFTSLTLPKAITSDGLVFGLNPGGQAAVNFTLAVDPNNPTIVYVSGDRQALKTADETQDPSDVGGQKPDSIGAKQYTATVFKLVLQPDGSSVFQAITDSFSGNQGAPHADTRAIAFDATGKLLLGTDGGLYSRTQPNSPEGSWDSLNGNLAALETYKAAYDPLSRRVFVAAQDNGVAGQSAPGSGIFNSAGTGDGFNAAVDAKTLAAQHQSIAYLGVNSLDIIRVVVNPTEAVRIDQLAFVAGPAATPLATYENPGASPETPPGTLPITSQFVLNRIDPRLAAFGTMRVYTGVLDPALFAAPQSMSPAPVVVPLTDLLGTNVGVFGALAYGTRDNPGALIAGVGGVVYVSTAPTPAPGTLVAAASSLTGQINALVFDPDSSSHFFAAQGTTIFGTANSGANFTDLRGNLPTTFQNVNAAEFISANGVRALFAGGSNAVGGAQSPVYVSLADALGQWSPFSTGLPNALVNQLTYTPEADLLLVATLGRGAWSIYDVTSNFASATQLQFGFAGNDSAPAAYQLTDGVGTNGAAFSRPLVKQGAGVLTLGVAATYTGPTSITAGTLRAAAANVFAPVSDHSVAAGAVIDLGGFDQTVGSVAGTGNVTLGAATLTTGGSGASTIFAGSISGTGGLNKVGAGVFSLVGTNSYTGATKINAGALELVSGSVLASGVNVQSGASLVATGAPSGGTPAQIGALATLAGSTLQLGPTTMAGPVITVTGPVTLSGNVLLTPAAGLEVPRTSLLLLTGASVTDNRALVTSTGPLRAVADPEPTSFSVLLVSGERDLAQGPLQLAVASAVDADVATGRNTLVSRSLAAGTVAEQGADLRALSGFGLTAFETIAVAGEQRFQSTIGAHVAGFDTTPGPARQLALATSGIRGTAGSVTVDAALTNAGATVGTTKAFWMEGAGAFGDFAADGDAPDVHASGGGIVLGAETAVLLGTRLGIALGYDNSSIRSEGLIGSPQIEAYRVSVYGQQALGTHAPWIGFAVDYARTVARGGRAIDIGIDGAYPLMGQTTAHPDGDTVGGQLQIGQRFAASGLAIAPTLAVQAQYYSRGGFVEGGQTGAELTVAGRERTGVRTVLGAAGSRDFGVGDGMTLTPAVSVGWAHEVADRGAAIDAAFAGGGAYFRANGVNVGRDGALLGASMSVQAGKRLSIYVGYDATLARNETAQGVTGGLRWIW